MDPQVSKGTSVDSLIEPTLGSSGDHTPWTLWAPSIALLSWGVKITFANVGAVVPWGFSG